MSSKVMFVLPEMKAPPRGLHVPPCRPPPTEDAPELPLTPQLLSYWGLPFYSELPEEGQGRREIMELYLLGLSRLLKFRNASLNNAFASAVNTVVSDEAVERGFIEEDSNNLAWRSFTDYTRLEGVACFKRREEAERLRIIADYFSSTLRLFCYFETLNRQHIATQFLDSLFLKLCQVSPGWMWRRVPPVFDETHGGPARRADTREVIALLDEEKSTRECIMERFFVDIRLAVEVFAAVRRRKAYEVQRKQMNLSLDGILNQNATIIQSAFRGYRERQRFACGSMNFA